VFYGGMVRKKNVCLPRACFLIPARDHPLGVVGYDDFGGTAHDQRLDCWLVGIRKLLDVEQCHLGTNSNYPTGFGKRAAMFQLMFASSPAFIGSIAERMKFRPSSCS